MTAIGTVIRSENAAIAPLTALSLVALIAVGGLAFDYSRMVSLDTELQDAADHAALAAASQLDRGDDQCDRATTAAGELVANDTRFATDGGGSLVTIDNVACDPDARRVDVTVSARTIDFTLTPFVSFFNATLDATAAASVGSAICKVPPLMMCNLEPGEAEFHPEDYVGKGIKLVSASGGTWAPGNFGFLNVGSPSPNQVELNQALAYGTNNFECQSESGVDTDPGLGGNAFAKAFNTRFDIYESGLQPNDCVSGQRCPASLNSTKDVVRQGSSCQLAAGGAGSPGWKLNPDSSKRYLPTGTGTYTGATPDFMGLPRDKCHAVSTSGTCAGGVIGDGNWDYDLYMQVNHGYPGHPGDATAPPGPGATRYDVHEWELSNAGNMHTRTIGGRTFAQGPLCSAGWPQPAVDRRVAAMAVINCVEYGVRGNSRDVPVEKWVDVFFVEPSINRERTSNAEIYIEVIGETQAVGEGNSGQIVRRDTPYLIE